MHSRIGKIVVSGAVIRHVPVTSSDHVRSRSVADQSAEENIARVQLGVVLPV